MYTVASLPAIVALDDTAFARFVYGDWRRVPTTLKRRNSPEMDELFECGNQERDTMMKR
jgi:hypothetical protein